MNCLVTKLGGIVNNSSLLHVGEFKIKQFAIDSPDYTTQRISLVTSKNSKVRIIGDCYFTNDSLQENLGKEISITENITNTLYISNGECEIIIGDKYSIVEISSQNKNKALLLDDFKYSNNVVKLNLGYAATGNLSSIKDLAHLKWITLQDTPIEGNIAALENAVMLSNVYMQNTPKVEGDISVFQNHNNLNVIQITNNNVSGNISSISNLTSLSSLNLTGTKIGGNVSSLKSLVNLSSISLSNMAGDIAELSPLSKLKTIRLYSSSVTGDLSKLPDNVYFFNSGDTTNNSFTWSERLPSAYIVSLSGGHTIANVDKMLQDQSKCIAIPSETDYPKVIACKGNRTSASDEAVQLLQQKGYTINITKV